MTDTAQPLPDEIEPEDGNVLTPQQRRRAAALTEARFVLATNGGIFGGQKLGEHWTVQDLLTVGDWILAEGPFATLEQVGALPISQADADAVWVVPEPDNRAEGTEISPGSWYTTPTTPSTSDGPLTGENDEDAVPTEMLPLYPEDVLPR